MALCIMIKAVTMVTRAGKDGCKKRQPEEVTDEQFFISLFVKSAMNRSIKYISSLSSIYNRLK